MGNASGSHVISAGAKLVPKDKRKRSVFEVAKKVRDTIKNIPGVLKTDVGTGNRIDRMITGTGGKNIQLEIIGHSFEDTDNYALLVKQILEKIPGAVDVTISRDANRPELKIEIDREKSRRAWIRYDDNLQFFKDIY
jgi:HAE1 family hydrophobic/amphiphilic exporter-1